MPIICIVYIKMAKKFTTIRNLQDKILVTQTKAGKEQAYVKIYNKYYDDIYRFIFFRVSSQAVAEEIAAEVFLAVWKYITEKQETIDNCRALLYKIARNMIVVHYRKHKNLSLESLNLQIADDSEPIGDQIDFKRDLNAVRTALKQLSDEQQQIVILRFMRDLSYQEIAQIIGKRSGAVRVIVHRSIRKIQQILNS